MKQLTVVCEGCGKHQRNKKCDYMIFEEVGGTLIEDPRNWCEKCTRCEHEYARYK